MILGSLDEFFDVFGATTWKEWSKLMEEKTGGGTATLGTVTEVRPDGLVEVELSTGDTDEFGGWFCLAIAPSMCRGCREIFTYSNVIVVEGGEHLIVVWPERDDPSLLRAAEKRMKRGNEPRIVEYEKSLGNCISFYKLDQYADVAY